jgi:hypothetical protein
VRRLGSANVKHFRHTKSVTVYKEFPGRSHYIIGQGGWEKIVDDALNWATEHAAARTATTRPTT